jgi:arylsulfatase A-like enzyme
MIDGVNDLNQQLFDRVGDPEINARISQYEMAFRMQTSVPELTNFSDEPSSTWDLYGPKAKEPGTFAYNCLMARRLAERGVRFSQVFLRSWDQHNNLPTNIKILAEDSDRPTQGLIADLKRRGMLDDTLVIWGGEFGRTVYSQGSLKPQDYGRDHHPRCFSMWLAGGGVKPGISYGETDDFSYNIAKDPVHIRDLHATMLHQFGFDHERLTHKFQGLEQKLTGVVPARVIRDILL